MAGTEYRQQRCPHGWVDADVSCEPCATRKALDEANHRLRVAEKVLADLVRRCEVEMADTIEVPEIQTARALLGLGA